MSTRFKSWFSLFNSWTFGDTECLYVLLQSVDYKGMSSNPAFERYSELAIQLQRVELLSLSREEKLAFFINTYNALVIHGFLRLGPPTNMWSRYRVGWHSCHTVFKTLICLEILLLFQNTCSAKIILRKQGSADISTLFCNDIMKSFYILTEL